MTRGLDASAFDKPSMAGLDPPIQIRRQLSWISRASPPMEGLDLSYSATITAPVHSTLQPSPLAGEGARRAGEGYSCAQSNV
jgi:hypothetical protein